MKENILTKIKVRDWKEAIRAVGGLLETAGSVTPNYTEAMINAITELGPYIVILPNFALAHAAPSKEVLRDDVALITLSEPVRFGSPNDPIYVILAICSKDGQSHLDSLGAIASILMREGTLPKLIGAETVEDVLEIMG
ncbi:MAG: PTS sugar transporter subunit IIA [Anaerolineaceae bacterium]